MNHLCNSHCEFCGSSIVESVETENERTIFSMLLVSTESKMPCVLEYGFQSDFAASLCSVCAERLLVSDETSYSWKRCHCCGLDVHKEDISAFRVAELTVEGIEQHVYNNDHYDFVSAETHERTRGPTGYTVCMSCAIPEMSCADSGHEVMPEIIKAAVSEGDAYEDYLEELN